MFRAEAGLLIAGESLIDEKANTDDRRIHAIGIDHFTLPEDTTVAPGERVTPTDDHPGPTTTITRQLTYDTFPTTPKTISNPPSSRSSSPTTSAVSTITTTLNPSAYDATTSISSLCENSENALCGTDVLYHLRTQFDVETVTPDDNPLLQQDLLELFPEQVEIVIDLHLRPYHGDEERPSVSDVTIVCIARSTGGV